MTTKAADLLRRRSESLQERSQKAIAAVGSAFNPETIRNLATLFASDVVAPVIRRRGRRRLVVRENPEQALAWTIGQRIRAARERRNWRQEDLARESGIARANVARLETGRVVPRIPTVERVARALGLDPNELFRTPSPARGREEYFLAESGLGEWGEGLLTEDAE